MAATALLEKNPSPNENEVMDAIGGVLCRCTGYRKIIRAIVEARSSVAAPMSPQAGAAVGARLVRLDDPEARAGGVDRRHPARRDRRRVGHERGRRCVRRQRQHRVGTDQRGLLVVGNAVLTREPLLVTASFHGMRISRIRPPRSSLPRRAVAAVVGETDAPAISPGRFPGLQSCRP